MNKYFVMVEYPSVQYLIDCGKNLKSPEGRFLVLDIVSKEFIDENYDTVSPKGVLLEFWHSPMSRPFEDSIPQSIQQIMADYGETGFESSPGPSKFSISQKLGFKVGMQTSSITGIEVYSIGDFEMYLSPGEHASVEINGEHKRYPEKEEEQISEMASTRDDGMYYWRSDKQLPIGARINRWKGRPGNEQWQKMEAIFEEVRKEIAPDKPSRMGCSFVCNKLNSFCRRGERGEHLYVVKAVGDYDECVVNSEYITEAIFGYQRSGNPSHVEDWARAYWESADHDVDDSYAETILSGDVYIVREVNDSDNDPEEEEEEEELDSWSRKRKEERERQERMEKDEMDDSNWKFEQLAEMILSEASAWSRRKFSMNRNGKQEEVRGIVNGDFGIVSEGGPGNGYFTLVYLKTGESIFSGTRTYYSAGNRVPVDVGGFKLEHMKYLAGKLEEYVGKKDEFAKIITFLQNEDPRTAGALSIQSTLDIDNWISSALGYDDYEDDDDDPFLSFSRTMDKNKGRIREGEEFSKPELSHFGKGITKFTQDLDAAFEKGGQRGAIDFFTGPDSVFIEDYGGRFLGQGSFRRVYTFDNDYIVKVAYHSGRMFGNSLMMNRKEVELLNSDKNGIYPKVLKANPNGLWQIQEKVDVIFESDQFMTFFPNFIKCVEDLEKINVGPRQVKRKRSPYNMLRELFRFLDKYPVEKLASQDTIFYNFFDLEQKAKGDDVHAVAKAMDNGVFQSLSEQFLKSYLGNPDSVFLKIYKTAKTSKYAFSMFDIRTENVGVNSSGDFVIVDPGFEFEEMRNDTVGELSEMLLNEYVKYDNEKFIGRWKAEGFPFKDKIGEDGGGLTDWLEQYDPTQKNKYVNWMIIKYLKGGIRKLEDIPSRVASLLDTYERLSRKKKLKPEHADINRIADVNALHDAVKSYEEAVGNDDLSTKKEIEKKFYESGEAELLLDTGEYKVVIPKTERASCFFGENTQWCTAANNNNMFKSYTRHGRDLIVILEKKTNSRWQFQIGAGDGDDDYYDYEDDPSLPTLMDERDEPVDVVPWFLEHKAILPAFIKAGLVKLEDDSIGIARIIGQPGDKEKRYAFTYYNSKGREHRRSGPAVTSTNGDEQWFLNGSFHRGDGLPATTGNNGKRFNWFVNGERHREDGPAFIDKDRGIENWYVDGKAIYPSPEQKAAWEKTKQKESSKRLGDKLSNIMQKNDDDEAVMEQKITKQTLENFLNEDVENLIKEAYINGASVAPKTIQETIEEMVSEELNRFFK